MRLFAKPEPRPLFAKFVLYRIIHTLDYYLGFPPRGPGGKVYHVQVFMYSTYVVQNLLTKVLCT